MAKKKKAPKAVKEDKEIRCPKCGASLRSESYLGRHLGSKKCKKEEGKPASLPQPQSKEALREVVMGYVDGKVFTSEDIPANLIGMVFMPVGLGGLSGYIAKEVENIGCVYGDISKHKVVPGRAVNGYPIFCECGVLNKSDWGEVRKAIHSEYKRRQKVDVFEEADTGDTKTEAKK